MKTFLPTLAALLVALAVAYAIWNHESWKQKANECRAAINSAHDASDRSSIANPLQALSYMGDEADAAGALLTLFASKILPLTPSERREREIARGIVAASDDGEAAVAAAENVFPAWIVWWSISELVAAAALYRFFIRRKPRRKTPAQPQTAERYAIASGGVQIGNYNLPEIAWQIRAGQLDPEQDYYFDQHTNDWMQLDLLIGNVRG
jgi:hypothetical protein